MIIISSFLWLLSLSLSLSSLISPCSLAFPSHSVSHCPDDGSGAADAREQRRSLGARAQSHAPAAWGGATTRAAMAVSFIFHV